MKKSALDRIDKLTTIAARLAALRAEATQADFDMLAYLIEMAEFECEDLLRESRQSLN